MKSALAFVLVWAVAKMMRRASARHLVWTAAVVVVIALPVVSKWMPAFQVPRPGAKRRFR